MQVSSWIKSQMSRNSLVVHSEFQLNHYKNPAGFLQRSLQCTQMYIHLYLFTMQDKQYELLIKNSSCEPRYYIYTREDFHII